jgi:hypothetical protein
MSNDRKFKPGVSKINNYANDKHPKFTQKTQLNAAVYYDVKFNLKIFSQLSICSSKSIKKTFERNFLTISYSECPIIIAISNYPLLHLQRIHLMTLLHVFKSTIIRSFS